MDVLGLDLGTKCGATWNVGEDFHCETWCLAKPKEITEWGKKRLTRTRDPRIGRLCERLSALPRFDVVLFEDVEFSTYTKQTQLWASLRSAVWLCAHAQITECVPVGTLKRYATGHGGATKEMMMQGFKKKLGYDPKDDNQADSFFLWDWAQTNLKRLYA